MNETRFQETAFAKVNLSLSILGRQDDGYHQLESLVVFAGVGDRLSLDTSFQEELAFQLTVTGPEAETIEGPNLVETVGGKLIERVSALRNAPFSIGSLTLEKNLPVAAGIGGGSADAGALIRLVSRLASQQGGELSQDDLLNFAAQFGADIAVCVASKPAFMHGLGECVEPIGSLPSIGLLLVNPRIFLSTALVFQALDAGAYTQESSSKYRHHKHREFDFASIDEVIDYMTIVPNDLLKPALKIAPQITDVLAEISLLDKCLISRLSGSGATCFGLFETKEEAKQAASILQKRYPHWWVEGTFVRPL